MMFLIILQNILCYVGCVGSVLCAVGFIYLCVSNLLVLHKNPALKEDKDFWIRLIRNGVTVFCMLGLAGISLWFRIPVPADSSVSINTDNIPSAICFILIGLFIIISGTKSFPKEVLQFVFAAYRINFFGIPP